MTPSDLPPARNARQQAFFRYKKAVAENGKPFFPHGVWHDVIAAVVVIAIIIGLSVVWFAQANCDSWTNVSCHHVSTPQQMEKNHPLLGPLYEVRADPATLSYHPRPEWYFYFLFELLRIFSNTNLVVVGAFLLPTVMLGLLIAWPFLDRGRERRPSHRPLAMTSMVAVAVTLLGLTYAGSQAGKHDATGGLTVDQQAMPGFTLLMKDSRGSCGACHKLGSAWTGAVGPDLTNEATHNRGIDWQVKHLNDPTSTTPGSTMPAQSSVYNKSGEIEQIAKFLETLGKPDRATDPKYKG